MSYLDESSVILTAKEEDKKKRMNHAWGLRLNNKYSPHQVVQLLMRDYGISQATAYREYNWSMQIFGDLDATHLAAERLVLKEALWNAYQKAVKSGNLDQEIKALKEYKDLFDFDASENEVDPNKIQAHEYHISLSRKNSKILGAMFETGVLDFNSLEFEDVDFKEVIKEEDGADEV